MPVCSQRRAMSASLRRLCLIGWRAARASKFPLKQATLQLMVTPEQPGHAAQQLVAANDAAREAIARTPNTTDPLLAPTYPPINGQNLRGFGWDIGTGHSKPRGMIFPIGSFGRTGFTGTTFWMDPGSDTYVILLTNAIHLRGNQPISNLQGAVATATAQALRLYNSASSATTSTPARRAPR
jgi:CubicO group peptidase (beta-lactamase class C family)